MSKFWYAWAILMACLLIPGVGYSQKDAVKLLSGNLSDARKLANAYLEPFGKGFGTSLNNGWYNSAKPHRLLGFDVTITAAVALPPASARTFDVSGLKLDYWRLQNPAESYAPTVAGKKSDGPVLVDKATGGTASLTLPQGANLQFVPAPIIQVGVGLPFHTEVMGRFLPKLSLFSVGEVSLWGVGVKNEFKEFIPGFKLLPINISVLLGYTNLKSSVSVVRGKQSLDLNASGFTGRLLVSKSIPVLTVYAGVGYSTAATSIAFNGTFDVPNVGEIENPLSLDFTSRGFSANAGVRVKLALIAFHFDYALGKYPVVNAGVGINFR